MRWPRLGDRVITTLMLVFIALVLSLTGALSRIDHVIFDVAQKIKHRDLPDDIVLVAIDEQSLSELGRWPWSRRRHAQLIDRLHADGAKVIGMDIMLAEQQDGDVRADLQLAEAIARAGNVVLPVVIEKTRLNGQLIETLPLPAFSQNAAALGRVHVELDADAIARSLYLQEGVGEAFWPHFVQAMLAISDPRWSYNSSASARAAELGAATLIKNDQKFINFYTNHQHLPTLSYAQVLRGEFTAGTFSGKLVLIGATASGLGDTIPTPVSGFQQPMPGVEVLANALVSMRNNTLIDRVPNAVSALLACLLSALPMLWLPNVRARSGLLLNTGFALLVCAISMVVPLWGYLWVPMSAGLFGLLSAYPLWTWKKLESASHFLDAELIRLQQEHASINVPDDDMAMPEIALLGAPDPFQRRIEQVRAAGAQLQLLEKNQRETLAFISHDIRVPLASAVEQIRQDLGQDHPVHKQLTRALAWTENFLQISSAQMLRVDSFSELDVIAVLHEVVDEIYPLTQAQKLSFDVSLPSEPIWVYGHAETLLRAVNNLLINALKYSPHEGTVGLSAVTQYDQVHISITDQGAGIAPEDIDRLFRKFIRLDDQYCGSHGVGLGLYFVATVARQHGGKVLVQSQPGKTVFCLRLACMGNPESPGLL